MNRYLADLASISRVYKDCLSADVLCLTSFVHRLRNYPAVFAASGGALAVAQLAADLHHFQTGMLACAVTPLNVLNMRPLSRLALVLVSASGRHPDVQSLALSEVRSRFSSATLITLRNREELPSAIIKSGIEIITVPLMLPKDGFLATKSVMGLATAFVRAYFEEINLPEALPHLSGGTSEELRERCLILWGPGQAAAACDLETRLNELGLTCVQVTDYRNLAHGRHVGLARGGESTSVVAFISEPYSELAEKTLSLLPKIIDTGILRSSYDWPISCLDLLGASMWRIVGSAAKQGVDPAHPGVKPFGRQLYHLTSSRYFTPSVYGPVERKLSEVTGGASRQSLRQLYEESFREWLAKTEAARLGGLVLDYDGTCCTTAGRYDLPPKEIRDEILRILESGLLIGFASGRGSSLYRDLRSWVPASLWERVYLGLYNGGLQLRLADNASKKSADRPEFAEALQRLTSSRFGRHLSLKKKASQISVSSSPEDLVGISMLGQIVHETLSRPPALELKIVSSAHSVDVIPADSSKVSILVSLRKIVNDDVLAIGDQGQIGGNDFELLSATEHSLSVERCSADPSRCWNLDRKGRKGPDLLLHYLAAMRSGRKGVASFTWRE